jgi:hypothetical protein
MDIQALKLAIHQYLDETLVIEEACYEWVAEPTIFYQEVLPMEADLLEEMEQTFSQTLFKMIKEKGLSETDCYKNANIDRRLFSKIRSNDDYQPRKNTVFALCIGLKLNLDEAEELLDKAGYSISHSIKFDTIMEYLIKQKIYDILVVNEILDSFGCPILGAK